MERVDSSRTLARFMFASRAHERVIKIGQKSISRTYRRIIRYFIIRPRVGKERNEKSGGKEEDRGGGRSATENEKYGEKEIDR